MKKERAGCYVSNLYGDLSYKSYKPQVLPPDPGIAMDEEMVHLLVEANKNLAYFDGLAQEIPDMSIFVSMYVRKEALLSSQIEGTQCTLEDVFDPEQGSNANLDVSDVINYIRAVEYGLERSKELPLCNRLLQEIHSVLLTNVRGQEKNPGEYRRSQNWIGGQGSTLLNARYVPPNVEDMQEAMGSLEKFINYDESYDPLIQAALIHYQFETIHPFLDGNGRIGRLLIVMFLIFKGVISTPALYLSYYLKLNRVEYYDRMTWVRDRGDFEQWVKFFLGAVAAAAREGTETVKKLVALRERNRQFVETNFSIRQKGTALKIMRFIYGNPILEIGKTAGALGLAYNTVAKILQDLREGHILTQKIKGKTKIFVHDEYLQILKTYT